MSDYFFEPNPSLGFGIDLPGSQLLDDFASVGDLGAFSADDAFGGPGSGTDGDGSGGLLPDLFQGAPTPVTAAGGDAPPFDINAFLASLGLSGDQGGQQPDAPAARLPRFHFGLDLSVDPADDLVAMTKLRSGRLR